MTARVAAPFQIRGWHVLVAMLAFFAVVIGVEGTMIYAAYTTFPGQTAKDPYEAGLAYNRQLAERRREQDLGWRVTAGVDSHRALRFQIIDAAGRPVDGMAGELTLERPATTQGAVALKVVGLGNGAYLADTRKLGAGAWDARVLFSHNDQSLVVERRLTWS